MHTITIYDPIYLLKTTTTCWSCRDVCLVYAIAASKSFDPEGSPVDSDEPVMLCQITELPEAIQSAMKGFGAELHLQFSKTADLRYFANRCHCGALLGDHYLISEPGEAFFPTDRLGFDAIQVFRLECTGPHVLASDYSIGLADEILKHHLG